VTGLVFSSLVCLAVASGPAEASSQSADRVITALIEPIKDLLVVELGRSRLVHFPEGIRRTALSNADTSDVVQVGPKDVLILGRRPGAANLTVWPASRQAAPAVIVVRVERRFRRDE